MRWRFGCRRADPELIDVASESKETLDMYGAEPGAKSFANNCLLARRLVERGTRFVQLYHTNWDHHGGQTENPQPVSRRRLSRNRPRLRGVDQRPQATRAYSRTHSSFGAASLDARRWARSATRSAATITSTPSRCGLREPASSRGKRSVRPTSWALKRSATKCMCTTCRRTVLHLLGLDHTALTFRFRGRDFRLTDVGGEVVNKLLA